MSVANIKCNGAQLSRQRTLAPKIAEWYGKDTRGTHKGKKETPVTGSGRSTCLECMVERGGLNMDWVPLSCGPPELFSLFVLGRFFETVRQALGHDSRRS